MRTDRFALLLAGGLLCLCATAPAAFARQDDGEAQPASPPDLRFTYGLAGAVAAGAFDGEDTDPEPILGSIGAYFGGDLLFDNQVSIGFKLGVDAERDHPRADPRGDAEGPYRNGCPPTPTPCLGGPAPTFRSIHMGLAQGGPSADRGPRMQLTEAMIFVDAPIGQVSIGRQFGYAAAVAQVPAYAPEYLGAADATLDLTGLGAPRTGDFLSGASTKLSVTTARILGVEFGLSYTPELEAAGLNEAKRFGPPGTIGAVPQSVVEGGVSVGLQPPGWAVGVFGAATYSKADGESVAGQFGDIETITGNIGLRGDSWSLGLAGLVGDNGWVGAGDRGYQSFGLNAGLALDGYGLNLEVVASSDDLVQIDMRSAMVSTAIPIGDNQILSVGVQGVERERGGSPTAARIERAVGAFVEWSFRLDSE